MTMTPISMNKDHYCADDPNAFPYIIERLMSGGYLRREVFFLEKRDEEQMYCNDCEKFLPDRYIEGTCPHCANE